MTVMECAEQANLYEAFALLSRDAAKAELQNSEI